MTSIPVDTLNDLIEFLTIAERQGFKNPNTVQGLKTACNKLFSILEPDQQTVQYVSENLATIKVRFQNLNKDVRGQTADVYVRRAEQVIAEYRHWKEDRAGWERDAAASARPAGSDGEKPKQKTEKPKQQTTSEAPKPQAAANEDDTDGRWVTVPLPSGFEVRVRIPRQVQLAEVRRIAYALLPYAHDWDMDSTPARTVFPQLVDRRDDTIHQ